MFQLVTPRVGNQIPNMLATYTSNVQLMEMGTIATAVNDWWGGAEFIYARAAGTIRAMGLCVINATFNAGESRYRYDVTEVPNTANLGQSLCVAMSGMATGDFGWFAISGLLPVNGTATVAANTALGITAAGQVGANTAGKQLLNARVAAPATTTVAKTLCTAANASRQLTVPNADGWFVGVYLSGTGIAAGTTVVSVDPARRIVTLSADTTARVNGTVTATYNNATIFYNVAHMNRPFAQGAIT